MISVGRSRPATVMRSGVDDPIHVCSPFAPSVPITRSLCSMSKSTSGRCARRESWCFASATRRRVRQLVDDLDVARHLERASCSRANAAPRRISTGGAARRGNDERLHVLLRQLRRHADHRGLGDVGVALEHGLDLGGRQVLTAPADHFLLAADERVRAVVVVDDEVAGLQPTVDEHRRGLRRASRSSRA